MDSMSERELVRVRLRFIDVIKSFLLDEPDAEKMSRWRGFFASLQGNHINPHFDAAAADLSKQLGSLSLPDLQDEFYQLFTDPFSDRHLATTASFYVDGRHHGETLARFRGFLAEADLVKEDTVVEAEDSLLVMLDTLARLIEMEAAGDFKARDRQNALIADYLEPLSEEVFRVLAADDRAIFYESVLLFLRGYLDLEHGLMLEL